MTAASITTADDIAVAADGSASVDEGGDTRIAGGFPGAHQIEAALAMQRHRRQ